MTAARAPRDPGEVSDVISGLRERIASMQGAQARRAGCLPFGVPEIDAVLPGGGLAYGALHEFAGGGSGTVDGAAAALFSAGIAARTKGQVAWCLTRPDLFMPALAQVGLHPDRVVFVEGNKEEDVLASMEECLSFGGLGVVVGELVWLPMTASRRLQLVAEKTGTMAIRGDFSPVQLGCVMMGLRLKGETADELQGMVRAYRAASIPVQTPDGLDVVDLCGTGGDGPSAGVPMTKHGTGAVSSQSGSSDVLRALGAEHLHRPAEVSACLAATGLAFLHGPSFNQGMRNVVAGRREAGIRSVFNLLGPMSNPARPRRQVIGVYDRRYTEVVAETLGRLGAVHIMAVAAHNGLDELSTEGLTQISEFRDGRVSTRQFDPGPLGFSPLDWEELRGEGPEFNTAKMTGILSGAIGGCAREIVVLNAAAAIAVGGLAGSIEEGIALADASIDSGRAMEKLDIYRRWTTVKRQTE